MFHFSKTPPPFSLSDLDCVAGGAIVPRTVPRNDVADLFLFFFYLCRNLFIRRRLLIAAEVELFSVSLGHHRGYLTETISKMKRNENVILIMNRIKYELTGGGGGGGGEGGGGGAGGRGN